MRLRKRKCRRCTYLSAAIPGGIAALLVSTDYYEFSLCSPFIAIFIQALRLDKGGCTFISSHFGSIHMISINAGACRLLKNNF